MSTALAIASVTQVLKDLLNDGMINHDVTGLLGSTVTVTALPPDRIETSGSSEQAQLNLFMYQVTPNTGWRNEGFPSSNAKGERISNPMLALNLHYLVSAYGASELHHEILLGHAMQLLHENPVLIRDAIKLSLNPPLPAVNTSDLPLALRVLSTSGLADQLEQIRITPVTMNAEEISKLWTAFSAKYRPSAAYMATVVLIESKRSIKSALPVKERNMYVIPFHQPVIETIKSQAGPLAPILSGQKILSGHILILEGRQLRAPGVWVQIGDIKVIPVDTDVEDNRISVMLPAGLAAGIHGIQVIHPMDMGTPPQPHTGVASSAAVFVLSPAIVSVLVQNPTGINDEPRSADLALKLSPAVGIRQRMTLFLNEFDSPAPHAYSFPVPAPPPQSPPQPTVEDIVVPVKGIHAGTYLLRIQVDGAESPLGTDPSGKYNSPLAVIP